MGKDWRCSRNCNDTASHPWSAGEKLEPLSRILGSKSNKPVACKAWTSDRILYSWAVKSKTEGYNWLADNQKARKQKDQFMKKNMIPIIQITCRGRTWRTGPIKNWNCLYQSGEWSNKKRPPWEKKRRLRDLRRKSSDHQRIQKKLKATALSGPCEGKAIGTITVLWKRPSGDWRMRRMMTVRKNIHPLCPSHRPLEIISTPATTSGPGSKQNGCLL